MAIKILFFVGFVGLFGLVGSMDYDDQLAETKNYCDNVAAGVWPDYKENAAEVCK